MDTKDRLIEKLKELIALLDNGPNYLNRQLLGESILRKEITELEKQVRERKPIENRSAEITFNDGMDDEEQESKPKFTQEDADDFDYHGNLT